MTAAGRRKSFVVIGRREVFIVLACRVKRIFTHLVVGYVHIHIFVMETFAFHVHTDLGLHFKYAQLNGNSTQLPAYTRLNDGDTVVITEDRDAVPSFTWFKYIRTSRATDRLVRYFHRIYADNASTQG